MNINSNELLLLSKKVKFGEGIEGANDGNQSAVSMVTEPEISNPQTGMNALMFQGMKNIANDPQLATELKLMSDIEPAQKEDDSAKEYVAPFKSNLAFQGNKAGMLKNIAVAAMLGMSALGGATMMTSCMEQSVDVDMTAMYEVLNELKALRNDMANQDKEMAAKYDQIIAMFQQVITMMADKAISDAEFQAMVLSNQDLIVDLLVKNGMTQEDALKKLNEILNSNKSIEEKLDAIKDLLSDIKGMLGEAIADFKNYFEQMLAKQQELINTNKQGFEELIKRGDITNETLKRMEEQNDSLIVLGNKQIEASNNIKDAIVKANLDSNANFDKVVATLNINKNELIAVLMKLGHTQAEIEKMTAAQIIAAISQNTAATEKGNMLLSKVTEYVSLLPKIYQEGKITNAQLQAFYDLYQQAISGSGDQFTAEMLAKLEQLVAQLENIEGILGEINETLKGLSQNFNQFVSEYRNDKDAELKLLGRIYENGKFQNNVLVNMSKTQENMAENIKGIKLNTEELLAIVKDDTKFNELIQAIKDSQTTTNVNFDYEKFEQMFKTLGLELSEVISMSSSQIEQAIKDFQNTYINKEEQQTELLKNINTGIGDLKIFLENSDNSQAVINAINNLNNSVNQGKEDVTNELKNIENAIKQLKATVDALIAAIGEQASKADVYFQKWDAKFDLVLDDLEDFKSKLSTIIANQKTAEAYLNSLDTEVKNLKRELQKLQEAAGGNNFSMEELEEMWQRHDDANYEKYSKLIKDLGLNQGGTVDFTTIEGLLASIDEKMDNIKDYSDILNQILNKLNSIDWTNPDYSGKLDQILEVLKNFKCNCQCGGNNEGVLDELEKIVG